MHGINDLNEAEGLSSEWCWANEQTIECKDMWDLLPVISNFRAMGTGGILISLELRVVC